MTHIVSLFIELGPFYLCWNLEQKYWNEFWNELFNTAVWNRYESKTSVTESIRFDSDLEPAFHCDWANFACMYSRLGQLCLHVQQAGPTYFCNFNPPTKFRIRVNKFWFGSGKIILILRIRICNLNIFKAKSEIKIVRTP